MKFLVISSIVLCSALSWGSPHKTLSTKTKMKACLAHLYTAQKAFYAEKHVYSDDPKALDFSSDMCDGMDRIEVSLIQGGKRFIAAAAKGRNVVTIDDQKQFQ